MRPRSRLSVLQACIRGGISGVPMPLRAHLTVEDVIQSAQLAWTERDVERTLTYLSNDVVFTIHLPPDIDFAGTCRGHAENRRMMQLILDKFLFLSRVIEKVTVSGDLARVSIYYHYLHQSSREIIHGRYWQEWEVRDGLAIRVDEYHDVPYLTAFLRMTQLLGD